MYISIYIYIYRERDIDIDIHSVYYCIVTLYYISCYSIV